MANWLPTNASRPSPGSWLQSFLERRRRHPDAFECGVRVVAGVVPGLSERWVFRVSAVDSLTGDRLVTLNHGADLIVRLHLDDEPFSAAPAPRPDHAVLAATAAGGARIELCVPLGDIVRFGAATL